MKKPAQRTPRTWQWAVKLKDGYYTHPAWSRDTARSWCWSFREGEYQPDRNVMLVRIEVRELPPAARQRRGR